MDSREGRELSQISTLWTIVSRASGASAPAELVAEARQKLLNRYSHAVYRYLLGSLREPHDAEELAQEFALRFLRGDLRRADRERGRFRDYVKGVLFHLVADHHRTRKKGRHDHELADPRNVNLLASETEEPERLFLNGWREGLLHDAWEALARHQRETGSPFFDVLRLKADSPDLHSPEMARELSRRLGKPVTADWVRQTLRRARDKFADLLLGEIAQTLVAPGRAALEDELVELNLLSYCLPALERLPRQ